MCVFHRWDHFPGPKSWQAIPFLGHSYLLAKGPIEAMLEMKEKYGEIFRLDLGPKPTVIVADFELAKQLYKTEVIDAIIYITSYYLSVYLSIF